MTNTVTFRCINCDKAYVVEVTQDNATQAATLKYVTQPCTCKSKQTTDHR